MWHFQQSSGVLRDLQGRESAEATFLFLDKAAGTLMRHAAGWKVWVSCCQVVQASPTSPLPIFLLDFLQAFSVGVASDRGSHRPRSAKSIVPALRFAAAKLQFGILTATPVSPILSSWLARDSGQQIQPQRPFRCPFIVLCLLRALWPHVIAMTVGCCSVVY